MRYQLIICTVLLMYINNASAQQKTASRIKGWKFVMSPVFGITKESEAKTKLGENSAKFYAWDEMRKRQYRDNGAAYFERVSNDPKFKEWFLETTVESPPDYWKDPEAEGARIVSFDQKGTAIIHFFDEAAENEWKSRYLLFRQRYLADSSITADEKIDFRTQELIRDMYSLAYRISRHDGDLQKYFRERLDLIDQYVLEAEDMAFGEHPDSRALMNAYGEFGVCDTVLGNRIISLLKVCPDSNARAIAFKIESTARRLHDSPAKLKLSALKDGKLIDLENMRGKVVMLDFWNIHCGGCISAMPKYTRIYDEFHKKGFEIYSVCLMLGNHGETVQEERARAIELLEKNSISYPVAMLVPDKGTNGQTGSTDPDLWNDLGQPFGGSIFLLDQQGRLIRASDSGQWLEFNIRKLLKMPLEYNGKL